MMKSQLHSRQGGVLRVRQNDIAVLQNVISEVGSLRVPSLTIAFLATANLYSGVS